MLDELTRQRTAELIKESGEPADGARRLRGPEDRGLLLELHGRSGDRSQGVEAAPARARPHRRDLRPAGARRGRSAARCAPTWTSLNATNLHTGNLFGLWVAQDLDDPAKYSPFLLQGGLGMPDREYYLDPSSAHGRHPLEVSGPHRRRAEARPRGRRRREGRSHPRSRAPDRACALEPGGLGGRRQGEQPLAPQEFEKNAPGLDWAAFFAAAGLADQPVFVVWQPSAVTGISALAAAQPLETWKDYLTFRAIEHASRVPAEGLRRRGFAFYGQVLTGTPKQRDRWKRGVEATNAALGEAVGKLYAERYFPPSEKARAQEMVRNIMEAFRQRIDRLDWMAPETRARAKAKLADAEGRRRLSGQVARLLGSRDRARRRARKRRARGDVRIPAQPQEARPADRPRPSGS